MSKNDLYKRNVDEEVIEKRGKLKLIECDRKAYHETLKEALIECKRTVGFLRKENGKLRKLVFDRLKSDEHIINQAYQRKPVEKSMLSNKTCEEAKTLMDYKVTDKMKTLNLNRYTTREKLNRLIFLTEKYDTLNYEANYVNDTKEGRTELGQKMRDIENRLEKGVLKCSEAEQINLVYSQIKDKLHQEYLQYGNNLDALEEEIKKCRKDHCELKVLHHDALVARNAAINDLKVKEEEAMIDRKRREKEMHQMKKAAEVSPIMPQTDKLERRTSKSSYNNESMEELFHEPFEITEEQKLKSSKLQEQYKKIQEVTGSLNLDACVKVFQVQNTTEAHLNKLIIVLERQQTKLYRKLEKIKCKHHIYTYKNDTKLQEYIVSLENVLLNYNESEEDNKKLVNRFYKDYYTYTLCKLWAEHMFDILPTESDDEYSKSITFDLKDSELMVFDVLTTKIKALHDELSKSGHLEDVKKFLYPPTLETFMETYNENLSKVSYFNVRIHLKKRNAPEDDAETQEDYVAISERKLLKQKSLQFVEMKNRKKNPEKTRKGKKK